jgi:hypothetical protein
MEEQQGNGYKFKGWDWTELAECWGITVNKKDIRYTDANGNEETFTTHFPETLQVTKYINGKRCTFQIDDEEEVLTEKIKQHMYNNLENGGTDFINKEMRTDIHDFLRALINADEGGGDVPAYRGILEIESDWYLVRWMAHNLETMWT